MTAPIRWHYAHALAAWYWSDDAGLSWYRWPDHPAPEGGTPGPARCL